MACTAASTSFGSHGKSGAPCDRFRASYCAASSLIRVKMVVPTPGILDFGEQMLFIDVFSLRPNQRSCAVDAFRPGRIAPLDNATGLHENAGMPSGSDSSVY